MTHITEAPVFRGLHYVEGCALPEPATDLHRVLLWQAAANLPRGYFSEIQLVDRAASTTADSKHSYSARKADLIAPLADLAMDNIFIPIYHRAPNYWNSYAYAPQLNGYVALRGTSRELQLSNLGHQIAAESARRRLNDPTTPSSTARLAEKVLRRSLAYLLAQPPSYQHRKPDPIR